MTCDSLFDYPQRNMAERPITHRWSLWTRVDDNLSHWRLESLHRPERLRQFAAAMEDESLILPPGETPVVD